MNLRWLVKENGEKVLQMAYWEEGLKSQMNNEPLWKDVPTEGIPSQGIKSQERREWWFELNEIKEILGIYRNKQPHNQFMPQVHVVEIHDNERVVSKGKLLEVLMELDFAVPYGGIPALFKKLGFE